MKNQFNLEYQYQKYLKMVKLDENTMPLTQRNEMRRTFMGACGIILIMLKHDFDGMNEKECIMALEDMTKQVMRFFNIETATQN